MRSRLSRGCASDKRGDRDYVLDASAPIAYLRIQTIGASTAHDLQKMARQIENSGRYGIILDLRGFDATLVHPAVLLADTLLAGGVIGRMRTVEGEVTYQADPDAVFRNLPMAVLVDQSTAGAAEWVAAALQDNKRAVIVGMPTRGAMPLFTRDGLPLSSDVRSRVPVGDGAWTIELVTGYLERGDGRRLSQDATTSARETRVARTGAPNPQEVTTGVKPDFPVNVPRDRPGRPVSPSRSPRDSNDETSLREDPVVQQAIRVLRQSLEKFI